MKLQIIYVLVTFSVVGLSVMSLLNIQREKVHQNHRTAVELSDQALQLVLESNASVVHENPTEFKGVPKTAAAVGNGWYEAVASVKSTDSFVTIHVTATGGCGSELASQEKTVMLHKSVGGWVP